MSVELQFIALASFVGVALLVYRLLVAQKDATIERLRQEVDLRDRKIEDLEKLGPDALVTRLSQRVEICIKEIERLNADKERHTEEIETKQRDLSALQERLQAISTLIRDTDLVCPKCGAPLATRVNRTILGSVGGKEVEADVEYRAYECGYSEDEGSSETTPCGAHVKFAIKHPS